MSWPHFVGVKVDGKLFLLGSGVYQTELLRSTRIVLFLYSAAKSGGRVGGLLRLGGEELCGIDRGAVD